MDRDEKHIVLIGFMGAGKTVVGKCLSRQLSRQMLDTDAMIEARAGMTINDIFRTQGEETFRVIEAEVIASLTEFRDPVIISTGGGVPLREENQRALKELGRVVYLRVQPETVLRRLYGDTTRPILQGGDKKEKVTGLLEYRGPIYEKTAHLTVDVDQKKPEEIARQIIAESRRIKL